MTKSWELAEAALFPSDLLNSPHTRTPKQLFTLSLNALLPLTILELLEPMELAGKLPLGLGEPGLPCGAARLRQPGDSDGVSGPRASLPSPPP